MCKCLRQFLGTNVGVTAFSICCNTEWKRGAWFISAKWTIPEFQEIFPGIDFVSIMYVKYWGFWIYPGPENIGVTQADCVWISLNNSWICLIISEYVEMSNTNLTLLPPVSLRSQFSIFENSARKNLHCFRKTLYRRCLTGLQYT